MRALLMGLAAAILSASPAIAKAKAEPPQPAEQPNWATVRTQSEAALRSRLIDPGSAQIQWTGGFRWGFYKPILMGKRWGWVGCGLINARNRMGGFVGQRGFVIVYDGGVTVADMDSDNDFQIIASGCANGSFPAPQAELTDLPASSNQGCGSIADELGKLAGLRDKGIISQAEFDAQKAKLLNAR